MEAINPHNFEGLSDEYFERHLDHLSQILRLRALQNRQHQTLVDSHVYAHAVQTLWQDDRRKLEQTERSTIDLEASYPAPMRAVIYIQPQPERSLPPYNQIIGVCILRRSGADEFPSYSPMARRCLDEISPINGHTERDVAIVSSLLAELETTISHGDLANISDNYTRISTPYALSGISPDNLAKRSALDAR